MDAPENPAAFPAAMIPEFQERSPGMSLRDWHAGNVAAAMVGSIKSEKGYQRLRTLAERREQTVSEWIATEAGKQADALLAEREGRV